MIHPLARPTRPDDLIAVAEAMREEDVAEVRAARGISPLEALQGGYACTPNCYSFVPEGDIPVAIGGVAPHPLLPRVGICWLLGTPAIKKHSRVFLRDSRKVIEGASEGYDLIMNLVDERNTLHIRWLKWCGFSFLARHIVGPEDRPFLEFVRLTNV